MWLGRDFEQVVEQRAVMHHGLAQVLGRAGAAVVAHRDRMGRAVVVHHRGMVH